LDIFLSIFRAKKERQTDHLNGCISFCILTISTVTPKITHKVFSSLFLL
jgi:hypothetical protein